MAKSKPKSDEVAAVAEETAHGPEMLAGPTWSAQEADQVEPAAPAAEPVMYVGPSKAGRLHVQAGTVFARGVLPERVKAQAEASRDFARLLVPMSRAGAARAQIRNPKSPLAKAYASVARMEV